MLRAGVLPPPNTHIKTIRVSVLEELVNSHFGPFFRKCKDSGMSKPVPDSAGLLRILPSLHCADHTNASSSPLIHRNFGFL